LYKPFSFATSNTLGWLASGFKNEKKQAVHGPPFCETLFHKQHALSAFRHRFGN
jgi:hypothetical protein